MIRWRTFHLKSVFLLTQVLLPLMDVVAPGAIETDSGGDAVRDNAQLNASIAAQTAWGRVGQPDDIGGMIALLLAPESRWINAQRIEVPGGMLL